MEIEQHSRTPVYRPEAIPVKVSLLDRTSADRSECERFIADKYALHFGAHITHFLSHLLAIKNSEGAVIAALGVEPARRGVPLFLERYLDRPIETILSEKHGAQVCRNRIAEVGNLATESRSELNLLYFSLAALLDGWGFDWAVFTATRQIRRAISDLSVELIYLDRADPAKLGADSAAWGRYYDQDPQLTAAGVSSSREVLLSHVGITDTLGVLWATARNLGRAVGPVCAGSTCKR